MGITILPKIMVDAHGGFDFLMEKLLKKGEIHYSFVYPDGSLEISTKDLECIRVLVRDPSRDVAGESGCVQYRSLAPFGLVTHDFRFPHHIERRIFNEEFYIQPSPLRPVIQSEYQLEKTHIQITFGSRLEVVRQSIVDGFQDVLDSYRTMDPAWCDFMPARLCSNCCFTRDGCFAIFNIRDLDQRVLTWLAIKMFDRSVSCARRWGDTIIDFRSERRPIPSEIEERVEFYREK